MEPRVFKFGTPYEEMYNSLSATSDDEAYFNHNGVLQLCRRGASVKVSSSNLILCYNLFTIIVFLHLHSILDYK